MTRHADTALLEVLNDIVRHLSARQEQKDELHRRIAELGPEEVGEAKEPPAPPAEAGGGSHSGRKA